MAVEPFKIINDDGSTNQSEYRRCIQFLNDYIDGNIKVYPPIAWLNPYEIDMTQSKSALELLRDCITYDTNRLLTPEAWKNVKSLFTGILERTGSTIHTCGKYLEYSKDFSDGPGYMYDVFTEPSAKQTEVLSSKLNDNITVYYLNDKNHTVLEYNDTAYATECSTETPQIVNFPSLGIYPSRLLISNMDTYPSVYKGYLSGVYSDFQRLAGQYVGSSTLFYYSKCDDVLYTSGLTNRTEDRIDEYMQFSANGYGSNRSKPTQGLDLSKISAAQNTVTNPDQSNAYIDPTIFNNNISYISPKQLTAQNEEDWLI